MNNETNVSKNTEFINVMKRRIAAIKHMYPNIVEVVIYHTCFDEVPESIKDELFSLWRLIELVEQGRNLESYIGSLEDGITIYPDDVKNYRELNGEVTQLAKQNEMDGPVFNMKNDPRITRVGKFLRKVSLDELMQFFNVLKGDMTLVDPRPPLPREVQYYTDYQKLRLLVTPGITCTWQIHENRNDVPFEEWVEMDIEYIQTRTYLNDIKIMLKTPIVMITATGR